MSLAFWVDIRAKNSLIVTLGSLHFSYQLKEAQNILFTIL